MAPAVAAALYKEDETLRADRHLPRVRGRDLLAVEEVFSISTEPSPGCATTRTPSEQFLDLFRRAGEKLHAGRSMNFSATPACDPDGRTRPRRLQGSHPAGARRPRPSPASPICARLSPNASAAPVGQAPPAEDKPLTLEEFRHRQRSRAAHARINRPKPRRSSPASSSRKRTCRVVACKTRSIGVLEQALEAPRTCVSTALSACCHPRPCFNWPTNHAARPGEPGCLRSSRLLRRPHHLRPDDLGGQGREHRARQRLRRRTRPPAITEEIDLSGEWESVWQDEAAAETVEEPAAAPPAPQPEQASPTAAFHAAARSRRPRSGTRSRSTSAWTEQIWESNRVPPPRAAGPGLPRPPRVACPARSDAPRFCLFQLTIAVPKHGFAPGRGYRGHRRSSPAPRPRPGSRSIASSRKLSSGRGSFAPADEPSLSALASRGLDLELGDDVTPIAQPRHVPLRHPDHSAPLALEPRQAPIRTGDGTGSGASRAARPPLYRSVHSDPLPLSPHLAPLPPPRCGSTLAGALRGRLRLSERELTPSVLAVCSGLRRDLETPRRRMTIRETPLNLSAHPLLRDGPLRRGDRRAPRSAPGQRIHPRPRRAGLIWPRRAAAFVEKCVPELANRTRAPGHPPRGLTA